MPSPEDPPALREPPDGVAHRPGAILRWLKTVDGVRLRLAEWPAAEMAPHGTILLLHGRTEFIEKYREVILELGARGFAVVTFDWRGQGGSGRQLDDPAKGHVEDFDDYLQDLDLVIADMQARDLPKPWSILAHSMGGCLALLALARGPGPFERAILCSPMVAIAGIAGSDAARLAARLLTSLGLAQAFVPGGDRKSSATGAFEQNPLTRDAARFSTLQAWLAAYPELGIGDPTIGWMTAAFNALESFADEAFGQQGRTPVLMLNAGADTVVSPRAAAALAQRMRGASAIELPGSRHEILMETDAIRALFWRAFDAFVAGAHPHAQAPGVEADLPPRPAPT